MRKIYRSTRSQTVCNVCEDNAGMALSSLANFKKYLVFLFFIGMLFVAGTAKANTIFVNVNNLNPIQDGTSWSTAFVDLQTALDTAEGLGGHNDIWVAQGAYFPSKIYSPSGVTGGFYAQNTGASGSALDPLITFNIPNHVSIFGGFNGTETSFKQRDPNKFHTVLSGAGTSWHVVILGNDIAETGVKAELNGLTITEGNAQGTNGYNSLTAPLNYAHANGGGIYSIFDSHVFIKEVLFHNNNAVSAGGAFFSNNCTVNVEKSKFFVNSSGVNGGAVEIFNTFETSPHISKFKSSSFERNSSGIFGGAFVAEGTRENSASFSEIEDCSFEHNYSLIGGAIAVDSITVKVKESKFHRNIAAVAGGALSTTNIVNTISTGYGGLPFTPFTTFISKCKFSHNVAQGNENLRGMIFGGPALSGAQFPIGGGAISVYINGYLNVADSTFHKNVAQNSNGGAIVNGAAAGENIAFSGADGFIAQTKVKNCKFEENISPTENGGAIASLPSFFFSSLPITVNSTSLFVKESKFKKNVAGLNGGAIYLDFSTAKLKKNRYIDNFAAVGLSIFGINSNINGDTTSPFIRP